MPPKALLAPQFTGLNTLGASPGTLSYAHGTLGCARHKSCRAGSVLPAGRPPPRRRTLAHRRDTPATGTSLPRPWTKATRTLAQPSNNPALKACAAHRLQPNTEHSTPPCLLPPATHVQYEQSRCFWRKPPHPPQDAPALDTAPDCPSSSTPG